MRVGGASLDPQDADLLIQARAFRERVPWLRLVQQAAIRLMRPVPVSLDVSPGRVHIEVRTSCGIGDR